MAFILFDIQSGISGDMTVAAALDLGVRQKDFKAELKKLNLNFTVKTGKTRKGGIRASTFKVSYPRQKAHRHLRHILDIIYNSVGLEAVKEKVTRPLADFKVVAYYGCYLVRPPALTGFDDPENPQTMDSLLKALGAEVPDWRGKVECCGGSLSFTERNTVLRLTAGIVEAAREVEAEAIVTACPMCQINLETRQSLKNPLPIFYFTELMAIALGLKTESWLKRHLISPLNVMRKHRLL